MGRRFVLEDPVPLLREIVAGGPAFLEDVDVAQVWSFAAVFTQRPVAKISEVNGLLERLEVPRPLVEREAPRLQDPVERKAFVESLLAIELLRLERAPQEAPAERLLGNRFSGHAEARRALYMSLVELLRNVVQHSRATMAIGAAQRAWRHNREFAQIAVADNGIGIFESLKGHHPTLTDPRAALDKALWPHISGTFEEGLTGTGENAGMGLFMIAEMTKLIGGRLLIATRGATLMLEGDPNDVDKHAPRFLDAEYPGTLVVFDIPVEQVYDFDGILETIRQRVKERTPQRAVHQWLKFEAPPADVPVFSVKTSENTADAMTFARDTLRPVVFAGKSFALDFAGVDICTQSYLHALLYEVLRLAWATKTPIYVLNAKPAVKSGLELLENYALGG